MKVLYTAEATVTGGRDEGHGRTSDGALEVDLRVPPELGGPGGGANPEQLLAVGFASCLESAIKIVAKRARTSADDVRIDSKVMIVPTPDRAFKLAAELDVTLPSMEGEEALRLVREADRVCPFSNAVRGNVDVALVVNGEPLAHRDAA